MAPPDAKPKEKFVGRSVPRLEDRPLLTGRGRFAADISFAQQLHMRVVRSNFAHGRIRSIDPSAALAKAGVLAVWTAADVADIPPIDFRLTRIEGLEPYRQRLFATGTVRYVGEPVAAVFAEDPYLAEDAAELVVLDIEELPALLRADAAPGEFEPGRSTEPAIVRKGYGDIDAAFRSAHAVIDATLSIGRHSGVPIETRGAIARYDAARDMLELHGAAKVPHWNRAQIARMFGRALSSVHLYEGHVGGGFGVRGELYPEDVLVCAAAMRLRRPVKWIEDRREHLIAANHSRQQRHHVRAAVDRDGRILAHRRRGLARPGCLHAHPCGDRSRSRRGDAARSLSRSGLSRLRAHPADQQDAMRNLPRARPLREHVRARAADGCDRRRVRRWIAIEVRRRNLIALQEMPYARPLDTLGTEIVLDSGDYAGLLDKALAAVEWPRLREKLAQRRAAGELVGAGLALFVEKSGLGPFDEVRISVDEQGRVEVVTGSASVGQGMETVIAQICADALGVDYRNVRVVHGQTDRIERGMGAFASRVTVMTGEATRVAAAALRTKAIEAAAELLQARPPCSTSSTARWCGPTAPRVPRSVLPRSPARSAAARSSATRNRPDSRRTAGSTPTT